MPQNSPVFLRQGIAARGFRLQLVAGLGLPTRITRIMWPFRGTNIVRLKSLRSPRRVSVPHTVTSDVSGTAGHHPEEGSHEEKLVWCRLAYERVVNCSSNSICEELELCLLRDQSSRRSLRAMRVSKTSNHPRTVARAIGVSKNYFLRGTLPSASGDEINSTRTRATPDLLIPRTVAAARDTSMIRPIW